MPKNTEQHNEKKQLAEHFVGKQFNDIIVAQYCERSKLQVVPAGYVEDYIYQMSFDERVSKVIPLILNEITKFKHVPDYISDSKRKEFSKVSDDIEIGIARILEDNNIEFRETEVLKALAENIGRMLENTYNRINSEGSNIFMAMAEEKFGKPLTLKSLMEGKRDIEKKLST